jgi:hypothetical protein
MFANSTQQNQKSMRVCNLYVAETEMTNAARGVPREVGAAITLAVIKSAALIPILANQGVKINKRNF